MEVITLITSNAEWRNFIIPVETDCWLSLGQWFDDEDNTVSGSEVALYINGGILHLPIMVGEPVRFKYAEYFQQLLVDVIAGDYSAFTKQYLVELELPFENDNQSASLD